MSSTETPARRRTARAPGAVEYALLAGLALGWGTSFMFTKIAVAAVPPVTLIAARVLLAALAMSGFAMARGIRWRISARDFWAFALVGLTSTAAPLVLIADSVAHVHSSVTAITLALSPVITTLLGAFRGDRPTWANLAGILVGLIGIGVLFGPEALALAGDGGRGMLSALGAALIFSTSLFAMALVRYHDAITVSTISLIFAALWTVPLALIIDGVPPVMPGTGVVASILVLALWNTAASSVLMFALVSRAGPTLTSYNNYLVPAVAVLCGTVFLGEPLTLQAIIGVLLVLAGVSISTLGGGRR